MASAGRRKRRVQVDESLITDVRDHSKRLPQNRDMEVDFSFVPYTYITPNTLQIRQFLDLRDSSIVQTGPKRPRGTGVVPLTPAEPTPLRQRRDTSSDTKEQPLAETVRELIESETYTTIPCCHV